MLCYGAGSGSDLNDLFVKPSLDTNLSHGRNGFLCLRTPTGKLVCVDATRRQLATVISSCRWTSASSINQSTPLPKLKLMPLHENDDLIWSAPHSTGLNNVFLAACKLQLTSCDCYCATLRLLPSRGRFVSQYQSANDNICRGRILCCC